MKTRMIWFMIIALCMAGVSGCSSYPSRPTQKSIFFTRCKGPVDATEGTKASKIGYATSKGVLMLVAWGDSSIKAAMDEAGCSTVHHIDYDHFNLTVPYIGLPIYEEYTTTVYGE
jgi:hypothetical protein